MEEKRALARENFVVRKFIFERLVFFNYEFEQVGVCDFSVFSPESLCFLSVFLPDVFPRVLV
jgi:hypothetical protein